MNKFIYTVTIPAILMLSACGSSTTTAANNSVNQDGSCTAVFLADYNKVGLETQNVAPILRSSNYSEADKVNALRVVQDSCTRFLSQFSSASCEAEIGDQTKQLNSADLRSECDEVNGVIAGRSRPSDRMYNPSPLVIAKPHKIKTRGPHRPPSVTRTASSRLISDFRAEQISVRVLDAVQFKNTFNNIDPTIHETVKVVVDGKIGTAQGFNIEISAGVLFCTVASSFEKTLDSEGNSKIQNGSLFKLLTINEAAGTGTRHATMTLENVLVSVACAKKSFQSITVNEIQNAMKGLVEISISK